MIVHEFVSSIAVETPLGRGDAIFVECGGDDYFWTVILENCAIVTFRQEKIRAHRSYTYDRNLSDAEMRDIVKDQKTKMPSGKVPDGMEDYIIILKSCPVGHVWLSATNWVQHSCMKCEIDMLQAMLKHEHERTK